MPFRALGIEFDDVSDKLMIENWIQKIEDHLMRAKASKLIKVKLSSGLYVERKEWIIEAETELAKFKTELEKYT